MHLPDDVLVPDGLGNVLTERVVRQDESCPHPNCSVRFSHLSRSKSRGTCNICATASHQALDKGGCDPVKNRSNHSKFCVRFVPKNTDCNAHRASERSSEVGRQPEPVTGVCFCAAFTHVAIVASGIQSSHSACASAVTGARESNTGSSSSAAVMSKLL